MSVTTLQDGQLRRLHLFEQAGAVLAPALQEQKLRLRRADRRGLVRDAGDYRVVERAEHPEHEHLEAVAG